MLVCVCVCLPKLQYDEIVATIRPMQ